MSYHIIVYTLHCRHSPDWPVELCDVTDSQRALNGDDVIVIDSPQGYSDRQVKVINDTTRRGELSGIVDISFITQINGEHFNIV